jgi:outer membrane protein assembly factor BamB
MFRTAFWILAPALAAADWPQWRGPLRDGHSPETGLLRSWPAAGPPLVFRAGGAGEGYSSLAVSRGRIFTQGQRPEGQFVLAFDAATGRKLWEAPNGKVFRERRGHGPRGTPTVDGDRVCALASDGTLGCFDCATGRLLWGYNVVERFGGKVPGWGISESPLIDGDRLIVLPGGKGAALVALDKKTGGLLWKSQSDSAAYSSAIAFEHEGIRQVVAFSDDSVFAVRADTGALLWRNKRVTNMIANIATPVFANGFLFVSSDYGTGGALFRLKGEAKPEEVYFTRDMKNHYSTSVLAGDTLYGFSSSVLTALDFLTGRVRWRNRSVGKGSLIYADGMLYVLGEAGVLALVEATPEGYRERGHFEIPRGDYPAWSPPAIAGGRLYLREQDNLYCWDLRAK